LTVVQRFIAFLKRLRRSIIRRTRRPAVGTIDLGDLDRITPVSTDWGFDRGTPVDRLYIERFLDEFASDVQGRCLEVADNTYTLRFGGDRVTRSDVLHNTEGRSQATLVLDLVETDNAPANLFDCIICTQTLHLIFDIGAAIKTLNKLLKPGGILLLTAPAITQISRYDMDRHGDHWRFTSATLRRLFDASGGWTAPETRTYGNVYAATAFLHGLAVEELDPGKLSHFDRDYEMLTGVRTTKRQPAQ
jgi:SAM-dependent methyltransferase